MGRPANLAARDRIIAAAEALVHRDGLRGASMDAVADAAGIKKANLFHYFPTKDALAAAIVERVGARYAEDCARRFAGRAHPITVVGRIFDDGEGWIGHGCALGNLAQELGAEPSALRRAVAAHLAAWTRALAGFLAAGRDAGRFDARFDPAQAAEAVTALFQGALLLAKSRGDVAPLRSAKRVAVGLLEAHRAT